MLTQESSFWEDQQQARQVLSQLKEMRDFVEPWKELLAEITELGELLKLITEEDDSKIQPELKELQEILNQSQHRLQELELHSFLDEPDDPKNCYLEVHPGAGGTESCDWAQMLLRMYLRWAEGRNFQTRLVDLLPGEEAGIKSATAFISGPYAYGLLKAESGVHRLVRISPFDANRRRHTSFASVLASPEVEDDIQIDLKEEELKIETFRSSGHGGQHVNVTDSAVRITHLPTGIVVRCQNERSQHRNKAIALKVLRSRLYRHYQQKQRQKQAAKMVKKEIAWGSQIRSYVLHPYNLVKDHRTEVETTNTKAVLDGEIDLFIDSYLRHIRKGGK